MLFSAAPVQARLNRRKGKSPILPLIRGFLERRALIMDDTRTQAPGALAPYRQRGQPLTAIVIAVCAGGAALLLKRWFEPDGDHWVMAALGILACIGLVGLLCIMAGLVHIGSMPRQRAFFDGLAGAIDEAFAVTESRGRVIYANGPYRALIGQTGKGRMVGIENLYSGQSDISDRIYRLAQAARERRPASEEFRLPAGSSAAGAKPSEPAWIRVSVAPIAAGLGQAYTLWRVADVSADRHRQEIAFSRLQYIINYLDHAPTGFFSADAAGRVLYINATLCSWLGIDV